jgi:hypothetical protein
MTIHFTTAATTPQAACNGKEQPAEKLTDLTGDFTFPTCKRCITRAINGTTYKVKTRG